MEFLRVATALGTVFGLLGLLYFVSNRAKAVFAPKALQPRAIWSRKLRIASRAEADPVRVLRRVSLTTTHQLHLVSMGHDSFLLCTHPHGCTLLPAIPPAATTKESPEADKIERYAS